MAWSFKWERPLPDISANYFPIPHRNDSLSLIRVASPSSEVEEEAPERQHLLPSTPQDILDNLPDLEDPPEEGSSELERRVSFQPPSGPSPSHSAFEIDHHRRRSSDLNSQESSRQESMMSVVDRRRSTLTRLSAVRMVATTSKTKHRVFMTLNFCLILLGTLGVVLTIKDMSNSKMGFRDLRNAKKEFFDVGHYPMGGMGMLMAGGCLDGISMFIFLCGYFCECQYYRHYMRFVFVNLLLAITATIVLFLTQENADHYLQRYFEYGATAHPEPLGNFIDSVQDGAKCCGFETPQDWRKTAWWENGNVGKLPSTCCDVKPIPISGSKETSHLIPLCTFKFKNVHPLGCRNLIFPIKGSFRIYAKFVGIIKTLFLIAVVVLCSMLYKDTWYMKQSEAIRDESSLVQNGCEPMRQNLYKSGILEPNEVSYGRVSEPPSTVSTPLGSRKAIRPVTEHENFDQRVGHRLMLYNTEFSPTDPRIAPV